MAGDWIKMRVGLTTHPRVMRIAECLMANGGYAEWSGMYYCVPSFPPNEDRARDERHAALRVTRYVTVTALLRFWSYANEHVKGEFVGGIWPEDVDEITGVPGFAEAIEASGWAEFDRENGGMTLPNFGEHNTAVLERNAAAAERQRKYRERKRSGVMQERDVTRDVTSNAREDKNREDKKEQKPPRAKRGGIPKDFGISPSTREWANANGYGQTLEAHLEYFRDYAESNGKTYADWDKAFRNCVRGDWGGIRRNFKPVARANQFQGVL